MNFSLVSSWSLRLRCFLWPNYSTALFLHGDSLSNHIRLGGWPKGPLEEERQKWHCPSESLISHTGLQNKIRLHSKHQKRILEQIGKGGREKYRGPTERERSDRWQENKGSPTQNPKGDTAGNSGPPPPPVPQCLSIFFPSGHVWVLHSPRSFPQLCELLSTSLLWMLTETHLILNCSFSFSVHW